MVPNERTADREYFMQLKWAATYWKLRSTVTMFTAGHSLNFVLSMSTLVRAARWLYDSSPRVPSISQLISEKWKSEVVQLSANFHFPWISLKKMGFQGEPRETEGKSRKKWPIPPLPKVCLRDGKIWPPDPGRSDFGWMDFQPDCWGFHRQRDVDFNPDMYLLSGRNMRVCFPDSWLNV